MDDIHKKHINAINMLPSKNEKLKWNRLHDSMEKLLDKLKPIEDELIELYNQKVPIMDDIEELRKDMVRTCIHPKNLLIHNGDHILCKFCNRKLSIPTKKRTPHGIEKI